MKNVQLHFPRLPSSKNRARKISDIKIVRMREMRIKGISLDEIAIRENVSKSAAYYWTIDTERRKRLNRLAYVSEKRNPKDPEKRKKIQKDSLTRKRLIQRKEIRDYQNSLRKRKK